MQYMKKYTSLFLLSLFFFSCNIEENNSLDEALRISGTNRKELELVLEHYKNDSLKLKAAIFLIENMVYHYSQEEYFQSTNMTKARPDITILKNSDQTKKMCDSLLMNGFHIEKKMMSDIVCIKSDFLINNIDLAFQVWEKPWAKDVPFIDFCRYILPYRAQIEKISNIRREIMDCFLPVLDSAEVKTPLEACIVLNEKLKGIMRYQNTGLSLYPTIDETYRSGISTCDGLCNLGVFIMRAVGIPVSVDQTIWTKIDLGHSWCVVLNEGRFYSFGPGEDQPEVHARLFSEIGYRKPAKVYRSRFDPYYGETGNEDDGYVSYLKSPLLQDVTVEYLDKTVNITVNIDDENTPINKSNQVYLCVYNNYQWHPIAIGHHENAKCFFTNLVGDNVFVIANSPDGIDLKYVTAPFYVNREGQIRKFIPDKSKKYQFEFRKNNSKLNRMHTLYYWDVEKIKFVPLQFDSSTDTTQFYAQIPGNALLWFTIPDRIVNQRVFFIEDNEIKTY